jgi:hypothetical protein
MSTTLVVSERAALFCTHIIAGQEPEAAARLAGYANAKSTAAALVAHPQVRKALREGAEGLLLSELVPVSLRVMRDLLTDADPKAAAVRGKLAVAIYDRATRGPGGEGDPAARALAQLTTEQLADLVARGVAAEAQEARTINVTPRVTPAGGGPEPSAEGNAT